MNKLHLIIGIFAWWILFLVLYFSGNNNTLTINIVGFLFLSLAPGLLTSVNLKLQDIPPWVKIALIVGLSLLELMVLALLGNTILPFFTIDKPLESRVLIIEITDLLIVLSLVTMMNKNKWHLNLGHFIAQTFPSFRDFILCLIAPLLVVQSIMGATSLNNNGSNLLTMLMLGEWGLYILYLVRHSRQISTNTIAITLYSLALSLLLMTSMRGWYITGHDIQQEYKVFELTKNASLWNMNAFKDPYNACLSITILPTIFFNLLKTTDPYIFKFFFQFFFAFTPLLTYYLSRHWFSRRLSFIASLYFIAFPTFFNDMAFLVRQEIAFLFFGLMLYFIFTPSLGLKTRRALFMIMGLGVILSHYSTTYTLLLFYGLTVVCQPLFTIFTKQLKLKFFTLSKFPQLNNSITLPMVIILAITSFFWTSIITNTSQGVSRVINETILAVQNGFMENNRSVDAMTLFSFKTPSQQHQLNDYVTKIINPIHDLYPNKYYPQNLYSQYSYTALTDEKLPLTPLGITLSKFGLNISAIEQAITQILAKLLEILTPLGVCYLLFRKIKTKYVNPQAYLLSIFCLLFIFLNIVLPSLSTEYGIFRAIQQSMFIIAPYIVIGSIAVGDFLLSLIPSLIARLNKQFFQVIPSTDCNRFSIVIALFFFLYGTMFIPQLIGGNTAVLYLNNAGRYFDTYLIQPSEVVASDWLNHQTSSLLDQNGIQLVVQTDKLSQHMFASINQLGPADDIIPPVIKKDSYVFLRQAVATKLRATIIYQGDQVTYNYPLDFLNTNKNLIYSSGSVKIYR